MLANTPSPRQGLDMKLNSYKQRIVSGSVAFALAAGAAWAAPAGDSGSHPSLTQYENIFLGEIETIRYSEESSGPGVVGEVEVVRERYPDGKVRIERQVTLNNEGNYVNHGAWKLFSASADVIAEGQYNFGQRVGMWTRWLGRNDSPCVKRDSVQAIQGAVHVAGELCGRRDGR